MAIAIDNETKNEISADLKEWLECKDFNLSMKAASYGGSAANLQSLRFPVAFSYPYMPKHFENLMVNELIFKHIFGTADSALPMATEMDSKLIENMSQLRQAPLQHKRDVLAHMPIVTTPIAAAYLGASEDALNRTKGYDGFQFGAPYSGGHCYSLNELKLIANNPSWVYRWDYADHAPKREAAADTVLDHVVLVDEAIACSFTNMTHEELISMIPETALTRRPYRLADLEKVRIAKLNAST